MKTCTNCNRDLPDHAEICECGKWFRLNQTSAPQTKKAGRVSGKWSWLLVIPVLFIGKCVGLAVTDATLGSKAERRDARVDEYLSQVSAEINKGLPMQIDKDTRLDSTFASPGRRVSYYYTLLTVKGALVDRQQTPARIAQIKRGACSSTGASKMLADGVTMEYIYRGNDNVEFTRFEISQSDCAP